MIHRSGPFQLIAFSGGPWDGQISRVQTPLPAALCVPITMTHWFRSYLVGSARYELNEDLPGQRLYTIVEERRGIRPR